jgi:MFS transporter, DHA2 family, methylenomycin A resistance protein
MGALTFGAIEAGASGLTSPVVLTALGIAMLAFACFVLVQRRGAHPMVPGTSSGPAP